MSEPRPGKQYTVVDGDQLRLIAGRAYGDMSKWRIIYNANQTVLKSGDPNIIYPGEIINIPELAEDEKAKSLLKENRFLNRDKNSFTLVLDGVEVPVMSGSVLRTIDTPSDGWTAKIAWTPGKDKTLDDLTLPYKYIKSEVYLGGKLQITGFLFDIKSNVNPTGRTLDLWGYSKTANSLDSNIKPPYEYSNQQLKQIATSIMEPFGVEVEFEFEDDGGQFDRVTIEPTESAIEFLTKLARERGFLISSNKKGNLVFTKANTNQKPIATIEEGQEGPLEFSVEWKGRNRYNTYKAIGQSPGKDNKTSTAKDNKIPQYRFLTFQANETTTGNIKNAAEWKRSKTAAESLSLPFPVGRWYDDNDSLWSENTIVTIKSQTARLPNGSNLLIRSVEFKFEDSGATAILNVVPPQVFTGEPIEDPWEN